MAVLRVCRGSGTCEDEMILRLNKYGVDTGTLTGAGSVSESIANGYDYDYYISPTGNNGANGLTPSTPWKTFAYAFTQMSGGDVLGLLNGTYSAAAGTGTIDWDDGANSSNEIPNGSGKSDMTVIAAVNGPGNVTINNMLFVGRTAREDKYIKFDGITFEGGGRLFNFQYIYLKNCGFHRTTQSAGPVLSIGDSDIADNSYALIEDCWVWGQERLPVIFYQSHHSIARRVVIRRDGLTVTYPYNPVVGVTVYYSYDTILQNVICVDGLTGSGMTAWPYADFATAQHDSQRSHGDNSWHGCASLNSPDRGFYFEADAYNQTITGDLSNCVVVNPASGGIDVGGGNGNGQKWDVEKCTVLINNSGQDALRIDPDVNASGRICRSIICKGNPNGRFGCNSLNVPSYTDVYGTWAESAYNQTTCSTGCQTYDPEANGLLYPFRVEAASNLVTAGHGGGPLGATIYYKHGTTGAFHGDSGYDTLSGDNLWPWPNEDVIRT